MTDSAHRNRPPAPSAPSAPSADRATSATSRRARDQQQEGRFAPPAELITTWADTLVTRSRPYALQQPDGTYRWRHAECTPELLVAHIAGTCTLALSSTDARGWCKWACLDADAPDALPALHLLRAALAERGLPGFLEASRRGGHLWLLLETPTPAVLLRQGVLATLNALHQADMEVWNLGLELYPDAASAQPGTLGHAVRLPLGLHRLTGKRYPLFDLGGTPCVFTTPEAALRWVLEAPRIRAADLLALAERFRSGQTHGQGHGESDPRTLHRPEKGTVAVSALHTDDSGDGGDAGNIGVGRMSGRVPSSSESNDPPVAPTEDARRDGKGGSDGRIGTHSGVIRWVDAEVCPLDLLAELAPATEMHRMGKGYLGWCPFHDDRAPDAEGRPGTPSFYVVTDRRYGWSWRCLSPNCAQHDGPMRHSFRLLQELLATDVRGAIRAARARWGAIDKATASKDAIPPDPDQGTGGKS